jgi:hypothetical protein
MRINGVATPGPGCKCGLLGSPLYGGHRDRSLWLLLAKPIIVGWTGAYRTLATTGLAVKPPSGCQRSQMRTSLASWTGLDHLVRSQQEDVRLPSPVIRYNACAKYEQKQI